MGDEALPLGKTTSRGSLTAATVRFSVNTAIEACRTDTFGSLAHQGTSSLLEYLLSSVFQPMVTAVVAGENMSDVTSQIWSDPSWDAERKLKDIAESNPSSPGSWILEACRRNEQVGRWAEDALLMLDVVPLVEGSWANAEWLLIQLRTELQQWHARTRFQRLLVTVPSENVAGSPVSRGSLQLQTSASTPIITAGKEFSIFVIVRNPFDVPVTLYSVETQLPVELVDVVWEQRERKQLSDAVRRDRSTGNLVVELIRAVRDSIRVRLRLAAEVPPRIAQAITASEAMVQETPTITAEVNVGDLGRDSRVTGVAIEKYQPIEIASVSPSHLDKVLARLNAFKRGVVPVVLQPGDSVVKQFVFRTHAWLFFTPVTHSLRIELRYSHDGRDHLAAVPFELSVQAALTATMTGAIIGGVVGAIAHELASPSGRGLSFQVVTIALAAILSGIAIVSFARKSNAQQLISIEDFWGGLLLGFLVGFLGQQFAVTLIKPGGG